MNVHPCLFVSLCVCFYVYLCAYLHVYMCVCLHFCVYLSEPLNVCVPLCVSHCFCVCCCVCVCVSCPRSVWIQSPQFSDKDENKRQSSHFLWFICLLLLLLKHKAILLCFLPLPLTPSSSLN